VDRIAERLDAGLAGRPPVGAPVPLVGAGLRVEHDHAVVGVAVRHEELVGVAIDGHGGRTSEVLRVLVAAGVAVLADLQQELAVAREF
jgi:hypothetical protein